MFMTLHGTVCLVKPSHDPEPELIESVGGGTRIPLIHK